MKVPVNIKKAIRTAGKHNAIAYKNNAIVRDWLRENAAGMYWLDPLIDSIEQGNDGSEVLIKYIENNCDGISGEHDI